MLVHYTTIRLYTTISPRHNYQSIPQLLAYSSTSLLHKEYKYLHKVDEVSSYKS